MIRRAGPLAPKALALGLALSASGPVFGQANAPGGINPNQRPGLSGGPSSSRGLPSALPDLPGGLGGLQGMGANLTPEQIEEMRDYDDRLAELARRVEDPALRATALNLVARSKIIARQLEAARRDLQDASTAAMQLEAGLVRDLRLMAIITNLIALAHEQVVEGVPNNSPLSDPDRAAPRVTFEERRVWLDQAMASWKQAATMAARIENPTYRNEKLAEVVLGEADEVLKIGRDARLAGSTRIDLEGQAAELLGYADQILREATTQAAGIDRAVWFDRALGESAVAAARSSQFARAWAITRKVPRPVPRAETLIRVAEEMAREAAGLRQRERSGLARSWSGFQEELTRAREAPPEGVPPGEFAFDREDRVGDVLLRLETLSSQAEMVRARAEQLETQFRHEANVLRMEPNLGSISPSVVEKPQRVAAQARELSNTLSELRTKLSSEINRARGLTNPAERAEAIARALPAQDDPALKKLNDLIAELADATNTLSGPLDQAATQAYGEAGRVVASIPQVDPRSLTAHLLVESLIRVGRFEDARIATQLYSDIERRYFVLGEIAESQGRRGLAQQARVWIEADVPEDRQAAMYRRVAQGVLTTVDQIRSQTLTPLGGGLPPRPESP